MDLLSEIYRRIAAFVDGQMLLSDFRDWIADASEIADEEKLEDAQALSGRVWRYVSEHGYGHRDDASLRAELARILSPSAASWDPEKPRVVTAGNIAFSQTGRVHTSRTAGYQPGALHLQSVG